MAEVIDTTTGPYVAAPDRYEAMPYRRVGPSGLQLPAISLGLWQNFGDDRRARDPARDPAPRLRPRRHPLRPGQQLRPAVRLGRGELRPHPGLGPAPVPRRADHLDQGRLRHVAGAVRRSAARASTCSPASTRASARMGLDYVDIFYSPPLRPGHAAGGDDGRARHRGPAGQGAVRRHLVVLARRDARGGARSCAAWARRCSSTSRPTRCSTAGSRPSCSTCSARRAIGCIAFSPLAQGLLTDRYLDGVPAGFARRAARARSSAGPADADEPGQRTRARRDRPSAAARRWPRWRSPGRCATRASPPRSSARARSAQLDDNLGGARSTWRSPPTNSPRSTGTPSRAASTSGRTPATRRERPRARSCRTGSPRERVGIGSPLHDLLELRDRESGRRQVLHGVRRAARRGLPELRHGERADGQVLRRVRDPACGYDASRCARPAPRRPHPSAPVAERRLVSVLFADLVGFTTLAEGRDAEDTRELLTRYFDLARDVIGRYGGTVEKFIGDAVMAVWGAPTAHEDDAERAVRAALDLVDAVRTPGPGHPGPGRGPHRRGRRHARRHRTRAWSRATWSTPPPASSRSRRPGTVLVGEATSAPRPSAIAFEAAGEQTLKGKAAARAGLARAARRRRGRRPQPRGRARGAVRRPRRRAPAAQGPVPRHHPREAGPARVGHRAGRHRQDATRAGSSSSTSTAWSRPSGGTTAAARPTARGSASGRSARWSAAGAGLLETDDEATTRAQVAATAGRARPRRRGAALDRAGAAGPAGRRDRASASEQLFGAWRTFFERLAATAPVVLVFEDFHFADTGLLDFVDHLLEWRAGCPIYVVTLARPELLERRPDWGAGKRNFTSPVPRAARRSRPCASC